jgi:hypothetical protein
MKQSALTLLALLFFSSPTLAESSKAVSSDGPIKTAEAVSAQTLRKRGIAALEASDYLGAADAFREAAAQGDRGAMRRLGDMAYEGTGVAQNYDQAIDWYCQAALLGDTNSLNRLEEIGLTSWSAQLESTGWKKSCRQRLEPSASAIRPAERKSPPEIGINIVVEKEYERRDPILISPGYAPWHPQEPGKPERPSAPFMPEGISR